MRTRAAVATFVLAAGIVHAQAPQPTTDVRPFEVASVKQSPPPNPNSMMVRPGSPDPGGRWSARNSTLLMLLQRAYPEFDNQPCKGANSLQSGMLRLAGARTLESLAFALQVYMDKRVVDRTGLQGIYEYDLEFDYGASRGISAAPDSDAAGGSVFTAVQEHLGLKLERRREMLDVLVIDSVEMPSEN